MAIRCCRSCKHLTVAKPAAPADPAPHPAGRHPHVKVPRPVRPIKTSLALPAAQLGSTALGSLNDVGSASLVFTPQFSESRVAPGDRRGIASVVCGRATQPR